MTVPRPATIDSDFKYRLLLEMSQKISGTLDLEKVLKHLLESLKSAVGYDAAGIFVLTRSVPITRDPGPYLIAGVVQVGFDAPRPSDPMLRSGRGIIGHVIRTGERVIAPDIRQDARYVAGRSGTLSEVAVPIVSNARVIGALNLESDRLDAYTIADVELLEFFATAAAISIERSLLHREVIEKQRFEHQLRTARDVQTNLLPARPPEVPGFDIAGFNLPTYAIGGDYYDFIPLHGERLGLVIADVSGKGVAAALIMATFRATLRTALHRDSRIGRVIEGVNRLLLESQDTSRFVTAVYAVLDPSEATITYVNCGHNPPMLLRAGGGHEALDQAGPALGFGDASYDSASVSLGPGDTLVLYTDGVVEPADASDTEFGTERLERVLRTSVGRRAEQMIGSVLEATRAFTGREGYDDDFTLVVVKRNGATAHT